MQRNAARSERPDIVATAAGLSLSAYIACLIWPLHVITNWLLNFSPIAFAEIRRFQILGVVILVGSMAIAIALGKARIGRINPTAALLWGATVLWCLLSTAWSIQPATTALYTIILTALLMAGGLYWTLPQQATRVGAAMAVVLASLLCGYLMVSLPAGERSFGGISPNVLGHIGLTILVLGYIAGSTWRPIALVVGISIILFAQSRTVFVGLAGFLALYHFALPLARDRASLTWVAVGSAVGIIFMIFAFEPLVQAGTSAVTQIVGVTDGARTGSNFTGRTNLWSEGLTVLSGRELEGYGFRTRGSTRASEAGLGVNAHSGLINALLDIGIVGSLILGATYVYSIWNAAQGWALRRSRVDRVAAAFSIAMIPILFVEPNYLNFSAASHFLMLMFLAKGLFLDPGAKFLPLKRGEAIKMRSHTMGYQPMHRSNER